VFEVCCPFLFFDYFRIPYKVRPLSHGSGVAAPPVPVHWLHAEDSGRTLFWLAPDQRQPGSSGPYRVGRYRMRDVTFFGGLATRESVPALLPDTGSKWDLAEPIVAADGGVASFTYQDSDGNVFLPFDPGEITQNFWSEKYRDIRRSAVNARCHDIALHGYYAVRPCLPRFVQLRLRRLFTRVQARSSFPGWPHEDSLHNLYSWLSTVVANVADCPVPYLDPWPDGKTWALVLTHDVETHVGYADMELLRGIERERGYRSSWNFVGQRYVVADEAIRAIHDDGCEVGVHGLRHDGRDLAPRQLRDRLPAMREFATRWGAAGFRSPATHREWELMPKLGFEYDSSYTDTDPYEPQPGGCCTYLPYFNQQMVELPITLPQDHTLFAILQQPDGQTWIHKANHLRDRHGMMLILTHPDYARDERLTTSYRNLLEIFQGDDSVWHALPREVAVWWRQRAVSSVRRNGQTWEVEGPASARARLGFMLPSRVGVSISGQ
jgi:peptidoglycan/xylan/chitin deacetylase (PgdA/CDA1 family)